MNEDLKQWDEIAKEWVEKIIPQGKLSEPLTKNALEVLLGDVRGKRILDAGCGNGRFTKFLSERGVDVVGVDGSSKMIELAKSNNPDLQFQVQDLLDKLSFPNESFDAVICDAVLMSLHEVHGFIGEVNRILKTDGKFIVSALHPAFNQPTMELYKSLLDKLLFRKPSGLAFNYFQSKTVRHEKNAKNGLNFYHRTLEEYSKEFNQGGFLIKQILEPRITDKKYLENNPKLEYATRLPRFIFFQLVKQ